MELIVHEREPYNAETPAADLAQHELTPSDAFYVRSHGPVPEIDAQTWRLTVDGLVDRALSLSLADLRSGLFPEQTVTATLQCAGNRRAGLIAVRDIPGEAPWGPGATGTATWTGVRLADVLRAAGPADGAEHAAFTGADRSDEAEPPQDFAGSVRLRKALRPEVLLAWAMNGEPLAPAHGAPLRAVVPGYIGARSVKWLTGIDVRAQPCDGFFQHVVYRLLEPEQEAGPGVGIALGDVALNAAILLPDDGASLPAGAPVVVRGYAFAGGERHVARVDVSIDNGVTWVPARLGPDQGRWAWRLWSLELDLPAGEHEIAVRAWDSAAATQPRDAADVWNPKGYVNNAWSRVTARVGR